MNNINLPLSIGISKELKIRGIIATKDIKTGVEIEKCPVLLVDINEYNDHLSKTVLIKYYFEWDEKNVAIVLGYGSLFNHSYTPNAKYEFDYDNKYLIISSIKNIKKGDEITINYNYDPESKEPVDEFLIDFNKHFKK